MGDLDADLGLLRMGDAVLWLDAELGVQVLDGPTLGIEVHAEGGDVSHVGVVDMRLKISKLPHELFFHVGGEKIQKLLTSKSTSPRWRKLRT